MYTSLCIMPELVFVLLLESNILLPYCWASNDGLMLAGGNHKYNRHYSTVGSQETHTECEHLFWFFCVLTWSDKSFFSTLQGRCSHSCPISVYESWLTDRWTASCLNGRRNSRLKMIQNKKSVSSSHRVAPTCKRRHCEVESSLRVQGSSLTSMSLFNCECGSFCGGWRDHKEATSLCSILGSQRLWTAWPPVYLFRMNIEVI